MREFSTEEIAFYTATRKTIDDLINKQMVEASIHSKKVDKIAIQTECEEFFFNEFKRYLFQVNEDMEKFYKLIETDNPKLFEKMSKTAEEMVPKLQTCKTFGDLLNLGKDNPLSKGDIEKLYGRGLEWFEKSDFEKAYLYFSFLTMMDGKNPEMWFVKGMAEQNLNKLGEALNSYAMTITLDPRHIPPYIQLMDCLILANQLEKAEECFNNFMHEVDPKIYAKDEFIKSKLKNIEDFLKHPVR